MLVYCTFYCTLIAHKTDPVNNRLIGLISSRAYQSWLGKKVAKPSNPRVNDGTPLQSTVVHRVSVFSCKLATMEASNVESVRGPAAAGELQDNISE